MTGIWTFFEGHLFAVKRRDRGVLVLETVLFLLLLSVELREIFAHSPWRDEVQALLIARQPFPDLWRSVHYEGHPLLWFLLLKLVGWATPLALTLAVTQALVQAAVLALIWFRSPFSLLARTTVCLGYFVAFEYGVLARPYGLAELGFFVFILARRSVWAWVVLALLANTSTHYALLACVCAGWLWVNGNRSWTGLAVLGLGGALWLASIWPAADMRPSAKMSSDLVGRGVEQLYYNSISILAVAPGRWAVWQGGAGLALALPLAVAPIALGGLGLRARTADWVAFLVFYAVLLAFGILAYTCFPRHLGIAAVFFIGLLWVQTEDGLPPNPSAWGWLGMMAIGGIAFLVTAAFHDFSAANAMADYARRAGVVDRPWAAVPGYLGLDLSGRLGVRTLNLQRGCWNTFQTWNYDPTRPVDDRVLAARLARFAAVPGGGYVLTDLDLPPTLAGRPVARFQGVMVGQDLRLYHVAQGRTAASPFPDCAAR